VNKPMMLRDYRLALLVPGIWLLSSTAICTADDTAAEAATEGLRVSYQSYYTTEIEAVIEAAETAGKVQRYSHARAADNGFNKWLKGGENALKPPQKAAVEKGETDALVFGMWWSSVGRWYGVTGEKSSMNLIALWGVKNNPEFRLLWQTHWATLMGHIQDKKDRSFHALDVVTPHYEKARKLLEAEVDFVNQQHDRRVVVIIPVTAAVLDLRAMVAEGKFPGLSEQSELFIPGTWNAQRHIRMLTAYCNFAVLFGVSPEGLSPSVDHLNYRAKGGPLSSMAGITAEQHKILQKLAWDTVTSYPYTGVQKK